MLSLEHKHEVKCSRDTERHSIAEASLTKRINKENCGGSSNRGGICHTDPRAHPKAVAKFPLTSHVAEDADEEVEDHQLVRATIVKPLIKRCSFPNGVEVETDCVAARDDSTGDDVVSIEQRASDGFADAINVHRGSSDEGNDEASGCCEESRDHQNTEPAKVNAVVC